ncbi:MAG: hypothetical protein IPG18_15140 [Saprospiraceae bacterium]|nr:hypothetical protein [Saprospiraceae bacterium]
MSVLPKWLYFISFGIILYTALFFYPRWEQTRTEATIGWDVSGYYMYLPTFFIYKDAKKMSFRDSIIQKYYPTPDFHQAYIHPPSGNFVFKYSAGQAIAMFPWFWIGHLYAKISENYLADGFSYPYQISIGIGMLFWGLLGLFFLRKILKVYYDEWTTVLALFLLITGSNLLNYIAIDQAMTHSTLFTIYTLIIWNTIRLYQSVNTKRIIWLGLLCGWAALIRPTDLIAVLIPLLWGINSYEDIKARLQLLKVHLPKLIVFMVCIALVGLIQPVYWKWATGEWIIYSYQDQGFSWLHPHVKNFTFSYKSGWLRYSPLLILSFIGIFPFIRQNKNILPVLVLMGLSFYIVTAWDQWDYGSTGGRAMVQYYPLFVFPMAALLEAVRKNKFFSSVFFVVSVIFVYVNIWWVYNAHTGKVQVLNLTKEYYWKKIGRWSSAESDTKLLFNNYSYEGILKNEKVIYENKFENDTTANSVSVEGNGKILLNKDLQYSGIYTIKNPGGPQNRVRVYSVFSCEEKEWTDWKQAQFIIKFYRGETEVQSNLIRIYHFLENSETRELFLDAKCPAVWSHLSVLYWNAEGDKQLRIDDLKVVLFSEE